MILSGDNKNNMVRNSNRFFAEEQEPYRFLYFTSSLSVALLLLIVFGSLVMDIQTTNKHMHSMVLDAARAHFNKDQAFRFWGASHGGVYVPISEETAPNQYLSHLPERDIVTPSGKKLTLMNPAYMIRQLMADFDQLYKIRGRITSLRPLNPINAPDEWEKKALKAFGNGVEEFSEISNINGAPFLRLMRPMVTTKPCLKCHAHQGYKDGDIRGGVGVAVPFTPYLEFSREQIRQTVYSHGAIGVLGLITIIILSLLGKKRLTERAMMLRALQESEEEWRSIAESSPDYIIKLDKDLNIQFINRAEPGLTKDDVIGKPLYFFVPEEQKESVKESQQRAIAHRCTVKYETTNNRPDGEKVYFESIASPVYFKNEVVGLTVSSRDITGRKLAETEKRDLESRLHQAMKLEAIGTLAGGITHDFNNILAAVIGYTEMACEQVPPESSVAKHLGHVLKAGQRAKDLVRQILSFSRQSDQERQPIQPHLIIKEALKLLRSSIPTTIEIRQAIDSQSGTVLANPTHIHQIVMNLCTNAYHAMRETGGILGVTLKKVQLESDDYKVNGFELTPGAYVMLEIGDTGCGMDKKTMEKIFDPYFTTKKKGEGTGLGLSVVHGIVKSNSGHITVYSEPGKGTTFRVYLPQITSKKTVEHLPEKVPVIGGTERILIVDDEKAIVEMERQMLESLGYKVMALTSSTEVLQTFKSAPENFDLLITDMTMPNLTGAELSREICALRPDFAIIICSGFSELIDEKKAKALGIREYIMKPIIKRDLAQIVRRVLDENKSQDV